MEPVFIAIYSRVHDTVLPCSLLESVWKHRRFERTHNATLTQPRLGLDGNNDTITPQIGVTRCGFLYINATQSRDVKYRQWIAHLVCKAEKVLVPRLPSTWANAKPGRRTGLGLWAAALFAVGAEVVHRSVGEVEDVEEQKEKSKLKLQ